MDSAGTKRCRVCGVDKPLAEMSRRKDRKDGYDTCCLACHRLKTKRWAAAIPEKVIAKRKKFYEQNPTYDRGYHQANAEKKRLAVREGHGLMPNKKPRLIGAGGRGMHNANGSANTAGLTNIVKKKER